MVSIQVRRGAFLFLVVALVPLAAHAQTVSSGQADGILRALQAASGTWNGPLRTIALELFGALALIGFVLSVGFAYLSGDGITGIFATVLRQIIWLGAWLFLLNNWQQFGQAIISSFEVAAQNAGGVQMQPTAVLAQGTNLAGGLLNQTSVLHPGAAVGAALCAVAIFVLFAVTAGLMLLALANALAIAAAGVLFLGFAGSTFTISSAMNVLWMTIGAGARLFMIELIAGLGSLILQTLGGTDTPLGQDNMWGVAGLGIVYLILIFSLPGKVEHMANGSGAGHAGPGALISFIGQTAMVASGAGAAASALGSAGKSMMSQLSGGGGGSGGSLPPPPPSVGSGSASSAGMSMRPRP